MMRILAVEDELIAREGLVRLLKEIVPDAEIDSYESSEEAESIIKEKQYDAAFLDIRMKIISGLDFAVLLKHYQKDIKIVFTTAYSDYASEAFRIHADGYIIKPVTKKKLEEEISHLFGIPEKKEAAVREDNNLEIVEKNPVLRVQTFGNFEVFINEIPAYFKYTLTKEMFAYLIDRRGALCTNGELISVLWEDASYKRTSYLKNLKSDLKNALSQAGCEEILIQRKGSIGVIPQRISCDYYDFMIGREAAVKMFHGEYMSQYSWAENTLSFLNKMAGE